MHVDRIPNRTSQPAFLLRETYREDGKVKKRTLANITHWPNGKIEALRRLLRDEYAPHEPRADLKLMRSLPHGHVAAALGMLRKLGLDDLLAQGQRQGARTVALVDAAKCASPSGLDLHVNCDNTRAIRFYEKHGFAVSAEETNPRSGAPIYRMSWRG